MIDDRCERFTTIMEVASMTTQRRTADEQYRLIMECRSSGLSDYQWYTEHDINLGTFSNWVSRLRKKACYEIPPATGRENFKPVPSQDIIKLEVIPEVSETTFSNEDIRYHSNDIDPHLLSQVIRSMTGIQC